jgi:hypothetical protein
MKDKQITKILHDVFAVLQFLVGTCSACDQQKSCHISLVDGKTRWKE